MHDDQSGNPPVDPTNTPPADPNNTPGNDDVLLDDLFPPAPGDNGNGNTPPANTPPASTPADDANKQVLAKVDAVDKKVDTKLSGYEQRFREQELNNFLNSESGQRYKPYADKIRQAAIDPRFISLGIERVVGLTLTPTVLLKIGAKMAKEAEVESKTTITGGGGNAAIVDNAGKPIDAWAMSQQDFDRMQQDALAGKFVKR